MTVLELNNAAIFPCFTYILKFVLPVEHLRLFHILVEGKGFHRSPHITVPMKSKDKLGFDQVRAFYF